MSYANIPVLRYMGNKNRLLEEICPIIEAHCPPGGTVCDLMAGTCAVGYALKGPRRIFANDVQAYSYIVARALIENPGECISAASAAELEAAYQAGLQTPGFFTVNYADTYFSAAQCRALDSLRRAIEPLPEPRRSVYLAALLCAMGRCQSTTGHFAQFLPGANPRVAALRALDLWDVFISCCSLFSVVKAGVGLAFCLPTDELLLRPEMEQVDCFYLDPPYTTDQYSRFYHILETAVLMDQPALSGKGRYRNGRFRSDFCYKDRAEAAFTRVMARASSFGAPLVISYSRRAVLPPERVMEIGRKFYRCSVLQELPYVHSTQGKGRVPVSEVILSFK